MYYLTEDYNLCLNYAQRSGKSSIGSRGLMHITTAEVFGLLGLALIKRRVGRGAHYINFSIAVFLKLGVNNNNEIHAEC